MISCLTAGVVSQQFEVGWPESGEGVWVVAANSHTAYQSIGLGILNMARTMDERCTLLERLGAVYFESVQSCPGLAPWLDPESRLDRDINMDE